MSEPIKLTQAQALFAVLAGNVQSRMERVYYRNAVLKSTLYAPVNTFDDQANNNFYVEIEITHINPVSIDLFDYATNTFSVGIEKTIAAKPEATDFANNVMQVSISASMVRRPSVQDTATNSTGVTINKHTGVYGVANDSANNTISVTVVKL